MIAKPKSEYYFPVLIHAVFEPLVVYHRHRKHNRHYMNIAISKTFGIATAQKGKKKLQDGVMIKAQSNFFSPHFRLWYNRTKSFPKQPSAGRVNKQAIENDDEVMQAEQASVVCQGPSAGQLVSLCQSGTKMPIMMKGKAKKQEKRQAQSGRLSCGDHGTIASVQDPIVQSEQSNDVAQRPVTSCSVDPENARTMPLWSPSRAQTLQQQALQEKPASPPGETRISILGRVVCMRLSRCIGNQDSVSRFPCASL